MLRDSAFWGCPDWRSKENYCAWENWSDERWRWEFKRRTQHVRVAFQFGLHNLWRQDNAVGEIPVNLMWDENYAKTLINLSAPDAASFGFSPLPNPLYSEALEWAQEGHKFNGVNTQRKTLEARTLRQYDIYHRAKQDFGQVDILGVAQVAIVFDPNKPIKPQLAGLQDYLEGLKHHSLTTLTRKHKNKWLRYLRILDARQDGASWSECASILLNRVTAATPQTAADTYQQAVKTRDGV